jgi:hypothetical protein
MTSKRCLAYLVPLLFTLLITLGCNKPAARTPIKKKEPDTQSLSNPPVFGNTQPPTTAPPPPKLPDWTVRGASLRPLTSVTGEEEFKFRLPDERSVVIRPYVSQFLAVLRIELTANTSRTVELKNFLNWETDILAEHIDTPSFATIKEQLNLARESPGKYTVFSWPLLSTTEKPQTRLAPDFVMDGIPVESWIVIPQKSKFDDERSVYAPKQPHALRLVSRRNSRDVGSWWKHFGGIVEVGKPFTMELVYRLDARIFPASFEVVFGYSPERIPLESSEITKKATVLKEQTEAADARRKSEEEKLARGNKEEDERLVRLQEGLAGFNSVIDRLRIDKHPVVEVEKAGQLQLPGRPVVITRENRQYDGILNWGLLPDRKPQTVKDVGAVIVIEQRREIVGSYSNEDSAYEIVWTVTIIDQVKGTIVTRLVFRGGPPPAYLSRPANSRLKGATGESPRSEVLKFINKLPVK